MSERPPMIRLRREAHELVVAYSESERVSYQEAVQALIQKGAGVKPLGQRLVEVASQEVARREKLASQEVEVASQVDSQPVPEAVSSKKPQHVKLPDGRLFLDLSRVKKADDVVASQPAPTKRFSPAINAQPVHDADDTADDAPAFSTAPPPPKFQQEKPEPRVDLRGVIGDPDLPFLDGPDVHGWRSEAGR